jgi:hypothetical protein
MIIRISLSGAMSLPAITPAKEQFSSAQGAEQPQDENDHKNEAEHTADAASAIAPMAEKSAAEQKHQQNDDDECCGGHNQVLRNGAKQSL